MRINLPGALIVGAWLLVIQSTAFAQATRTWVSGVGDDVNPCSRTAPCKTFAGAISKTAAGGEISVLDPGGFGAVTITKSITINGTGSLGGILGAGTNGIIVNGAVTDVVRLRYLDINGVGTGLNGIRALSVGTLLIENSVIGGFTSHGISIETAADVNVVISDTVSRNNTLAGLKVTTTAGVARASITRSQFVKNGIGVQASSGSRVTASNSSFSANGSNGVQIEGLTAARTSTANLDSCQVANNGGAGVIAGSASSLATSTARLSNVLVANNIGNGVAIQTTGVVESYVNNMIRGNGVNGCVGCTPVAFD